MAKNIIREQYVLELLKGLLQLNYLLDLNALGLNKLNSEKTQKQLKKQFNLFTQNKVKRLQNPLNRNHLEDQMNWLHVIKISVKKLIQ